MYNVAKYIIILAGNAILTEILYNALFSFNMYSEEAPNVNWLSSCLITLRLAWIFALRGALYSYCEKLTLILDNHVAVSHLDFH